MDCFFARNDRGVKSGEFFFFAVFVLTFCGYGLLRRFTPRNDSTLASSLRGFEKAVAISFILGSSLREFVELVAISVWQPLHTTQACHCEGRRPVAIHKKLKIKN